MQQSSAIFFLFLLAIAYLVWVYINALLDPAMDIKYNGFTVSAVADDSERQLIVLMIIVLMAYVVATLLFESGKNKASDFVPGLGLVFVLALFGTLLCRLSWSPWVHYGFAALTFFVLFLLCVAMSPHASFPILCFALSALVALGFIPAIVLGAASPSSDTSKWLAAGEFISILSIVVITYLFFDKKQQQ